MCINSYHALKKEGNLIQEFCFNLEEYCTLKRFANHTAY